MRYRYFAPLVTFAAVTASVAQSAQSLSRGNPSEADGDAETGDLVAGTIAYTGGGGDTNVSLVIRQSFDGTTWITRKTIALSSGSESADVYEPLDGLPYVATELVVTGAAPTSIDGTLHIASSGNFTAAAA